MGRAGLRPRAAKPAAVLEGRARGRGWKLRGNESVKSRGGRGVRIRHTGALRTGGARVAPRGEGASCSVAVTAWHVEVLPSPGRSWLFVRLGGFSLEFINIRKEERAARTQVRRTAAL